MIEGIVGKDLKGRGDNVVLAAKAHIPMGHDPNQRAIRAAGSPEVDTDYSALPNGAGASLV